MEGEDAALDATPVWRNRVQMFQGAPRGPSALRASKQALTAQRRSAACRHII